MEWAFSVEKRHNGTRLTQKTLRVPLPLQWGQFLRGGYGSVQVVWRTDLDVDLELTQNYWVEFLALYPRRMIIKIQYSMMFLACSGTITISGSSLADLEQETNLELLNLHCWLKANKLSQIGRASCRERV